MEGRTRPRLLVSEDKAEEKISKRIGKGQTLYNRQIDSEDELRNAVEECKKWSKYNKDLLSKLFDNIPADDYSGFSDWGITNFSTGLGYRATEPAFSQRLNNYYKSMNSSIDSLEGILDRLELYGEPSDNDSPTFGNEVFIVHGHDEAGKHKLAKFINDLDLTAIILDEQPSKGQTIIDKFEEHAEEAGFAIVLLTADDVGSPKDKTGELKPRARQNVILELGYFLRGLGRERVRILYEEGVELPSDIHGIIYVQMDERGAWKLELAQEMASVGITVDMNKLLPNR